MNAREFLFGFLMFTVGALAVRAHGNQVIADWRAECSYWEGHNDSDTLAVTVRDNEDGSQEIVPVKVK